MNLTYAKDKFVTHTKQFFWSSGKLEHVEISHGPDRKMQPQKNGMGLPLPKGSHPGRIYRNVPRTWQNYKKSTMPDGRVIEVPMSIIDVRKWYRYKSRMEKAEKDRAVTQPPLFTNSLRRMKAGVQHAFGRSMQRYGTLFLFSKKARILAGKR